MARRANYGLIREVKRGRKTTPETVREYKNIDNNARFALAQRGSNLAETMRNITSASYLLDSVSSMVETVFGDDVIPSSAIRHTVYNRLTTWERVAAPLNMTTVSGGYNVNRKPSVCGDHTATIVRVWTNDNNKQVGITVKLEWQNNNPMYYNLRTDSKGNIVFRAYGMVSLFRLLDDGMAVTANRQAENVDAGTVRFVLQPKHIGEAVVRAKQ